MGRHKGTDEFLGQGHFVPPGDNPGEPPYVFVAGYAATKMETKSGVMTGIRASLNNQPSLANGGVSVLTRGGLICVV
jgi:hypothetical protein